MPHSIVAIVCGNGLGHFRRTVGVLARCLQRSAELSVGLVAARWQRERLHDWAPLQALSRSSRVELLDALLPAHVGWSADPTDFEDDRLAPWPATGALAEVVQSAALVVSDNLVEVLALRADAVLLGSFLWADVLGAVHGGHPKVAAFVERERELLARCRPPMLCVGDVAMDGVLQRAQAVALPWMCDEPDAAEAHPLPPAGLTPRVAVLGGATGAASDVLRELAIVLAQSGRYELTMPVSPLQASLGARPFGFTARDYGALSAALCRPGLGTVQDCVGAGVPIVAAYEPMNVELAHTGRRLQALGFGRDLGASVERNALLDALAQVHEPAIAASIRRRLRSAARDGLDQAAAWLVERWRRPALG